MFFAIAALLIQPHVTAQLYLSAGKAESFAKAASSEAAFSETIMPPSLKEASARVAAPDPVALPDAPVPAASPEPVAPIEAGKYPLSVPPFSVETRRDRRLWMGLALATHSTATFDAWTTRHAITVNGAQELNPVLKPFAGNASMYVAIQVGPALMDYVGRKMMYSRHGWIRNLWWIPQSASIASSLFCGAHNLGVPPRSN